MSGKKNTSFLERLHFYKLEYDADLDHSKENLFGVQKFCVFVCRKVNITHTTKGKNVRIIQSMTK